MRVIRGQGDRGRRRPRGRRAGLAPPGAPGRLRGRRHPL